MLNGVVIIATSIVSHELLHGVVLQLFGYKPHFLVRLGVPHASVASRSYLTRTHYLVVSLTPLFVITSCGFIGLIILPPQPGTLVLTTILLNMAASIGDLLVAAEY